MNTTQPIRDLEELQRLKNYYREIKPNKRNQFLIIVGLNTALRISDILSLRWCDIYDFETEKYHSHINLKEKKTGKLTCIYLNQSIIEAAEPYYEEQMEKNEHSEDFPQRYLFVGQKSTSIPISRIQAYRIITNAASETGIEQPISCHSLRKTFGYHAWKQGCAPSLLTNIYNHSSYQITIRYLCIDQDDRDEIFRKIKL